MLGKHLIMNAKGEIIRQYEPKPEEFKAACDAAKEIVIADGGTLYVCTVLRSYEQVVTAKEGSVG